MSRLINSKPFYVLVSILFAVFLFLNVNSSAALNDGSVQPGGQVYTATLENIPISVQYNFDKYFISGYNSTATVTLSSNNQVEILQEKSTDLRTFKLVADLSDIGTGTHTIPIVVKNLSSDMNAKTSPNSLAITVERKKSKVFDVSPIVDKSLIPENYTLTSITTSPSRVVVIAGTDSINNVKLVQAVLPSDTDLTKETTITVNLQAVDRSGKIVPAIFSQTSVRMTVKLSKNG
ncbi:MAG TPA: CdaR family protein [Lactovum miscens]|uniref:CdaR family protein n=1 Tax=Lactovum miscens TaxID=190387 RepID=UPI002ED79F4F